MDPYAAQTQTLLTYPPPPSSQPHDPYTYTQYDPSQYQQQQQYDPSPQYYAAYYSQIPQHQPQYDQQLPQQQYHPPLYPEQPPQQQQYQQAEQEHAPIHPPGVPAQPDPNQYAPYHQPQYQTTDPNYYYHYQQHEQQPQQLGYSDPAVAHPVQPQWQPGQGQPDGYGATSFYPPPIVQGGKLGNSGRGSGRGGSWGGSRGGSRGGNRGGGSSFFGRGGARGSGGRGVGGRGGITRVKTERFLAWCELCRIECNTHEVLENHKSGKKHKKNLEIQEELQRLSGKTHMPAVIDRPEIKVETQMMQFKEQGNNLKRKIRDEDGKSAEPDKEPVPFICELCDVKCESASVFDSHLKGQKHKFNFQRFQEQEAQAAMGQAALQALYPALEAALYPVLLQALSHNASSSYAYGGAGYDQQALQILQPYLPQTRPVSFPHGPAPALTTVPTLGPQRLNLVATQETVENKVEPESNTEDEVKIENKTGDQVEPVSKTGDQVESESMTEGKVESGSKTEGQVESENKTKAVVEPESKSEDQVEHEIKTGQVNPKAVELTS